MARPRPIRVREPGTAPRPSSISPGKVDASDWPVQAADTIERAVLSVRNKTTGPAITAARWLVAGLFLILAGTMAAILVVVAGVRALDAYLPSSVLGEQHVWAAHGLIGLFPFAGGLLLLSKRSRPGAP